MTGLKGFLVAYHRLDINDVVKKFKVNPSTRMFRLNGLMDNSVYLVCVVTQGSSYTDYSLYSEFAEAIRLDEEGDEPFPYSDHHVLNQEMADLHEFEIPSSNDTRYLITTPIVLNLDSKSSRCNKIKTPLDPSKLSMIDNKQLSAIIGCSAGLMVFFCIILSIIMAKPKHNDEEEVIVPKSESLTGSYKTPSPKSCSESLGQDRKSFSNSAGSSLTRLNGLEEPDHNLGHQNGNGTLKKRGQKSSSAPRGRRGLSVQSSTESGPPSHGSQRTSRHSSSELSGKDTVRRRGGSTEQLNGRVSRGGQYLEPGHRSSQHLEQLQEQHTFPRGQRGPRGREEGHHSGTLPPPPQRYGYNVNGTAEDCIPMIEYPDMNNSNHSSPQTLSVPRQPGQPALRGRGGRPRQRGRGRGGGPPPHPKPPACPPPEQEIDYYPMEGNTRNGYIQYNSMARY